MTREVATTRAPVLAAVDLSAGYGKTQVLRGVNLDVAEGEIVALLGPNGAGKSTLLLALAGYLRPMAGTVLLDGRPCTAPPHRRARSGIAFLGEDFHVFRSLTVAQSLRLTAEARGVASSRFGEIHSLLRRRSVLLSGGEQKMLMLAQALGNHPRVILFDELSLGLAPIVRNRLLLLLRELAAEGTAVIVVEQSVRAVLDVADRAYLLRRGEVVDEGPAQAWKGDLDGLASLYLS